MNGFFEYWNNLTCFDATDSLYFDPNYHGSCIITNLDITDFQEPNILIYPNPATEFISVVMTAVHDDISFSISNITGQLLETGQLQIQGGTIDISNLKKGIYILTININNVFSKSIFLKE